MATIEDLGKKVKAKYPGTYDDISDVELGKKVKAKYPTAYSDFNDTPAPQSAKPIISKVPGATMLSNIGLGIGSEIGQAGIGLGQLVTKAAGKVAGVLDRFTGGNSKQSYDNLNKAEEDVKQNIFVKPFEKQLSTPSGKTGLAVGTAAEFMMPSNPVTKAKSIINAGIEGTKLVSGARKAVTAATESGEKAPFITRAIPKIADLAKIGLHTVPEAVSAYTVELSRTGGDAEKAKTAAKWAALISGGIEGTGMLLSEAGNPFVKAARKIYQSALKPSNAKGASPAKDVVETGLKEGIQLTERGLDKTAAKIDTLESQLDDAIKTAGKNNKTVKTATLRPFVEDAKATLGETVDVAGSKKAVTTIDAMYNNLIRKYGEEIPIEKAQELKVNTYRVLKNSYGELANATREGMKQITRGLKEGIVDAAPQAEGINSRLKALYQFDEALSRSLGRFKNADILGLGTKILATSDNKLIQLGSAVNQLLGSPISKSGGAIYLYRIGKFLQTLSPSETAEFAASQNGRQLIARLTGKGMELGPEEKAIAQKITSYLDNPKLGLSIEDVSGIPKSANPESVSKQMDANDIRIIETYLQNPADMKAFTEAQPILEGMKIDKADSKTQARFLKEAVAYARSRLTKTINVKVIK